MVLSISLPRALWHPFFQRHVSSSKKLVVDSSYSPSKFHLQHSFSSNNHKHPTFSVYWSKISTPTIPFFNSWISTVNPTTFVYPSPVLHFYIPLILLIPCSVIITTSWPLSLATLPFIFFSFLSWTSLYVPVFIFHLSHFLLPAQTRQLNILGEKTPHFLNVTTNVKWAFNDTWFTF